VGVYGTDGNNVQAFPTIWADCGRVRAAADPSGDASSDPSLPVWAQMQEQISKQAGQIQSNAEHIEDLQSDYKSVRYLEVEKEIASGSTQFDKNNNSVFEDPKLITDKFKDGQTIVVYDNGVRYEGKLLRGEYDGSPGLIAGSIFSEDFPFLIMIASFGL